MPQLAALEHAFVDVHDNEYAVTSRVTMPCASSVHITFLLKLPQGPLHVSIDKCNGMHRRASYRYSERPTRARPDLTRVGVTMQTIKAGDMIKLMAT